MGCEECCGMELQIARSLACCPPKRIDGKLVACVEMMGPEMPSLGEMLEGQHRAKPSVGP